MYERPAYTFPFSAIVGQETLKTSLLLNAVDPRVGGVLIRGEKGTAKSTAVRALASVLPAMDVVEGCVYGCDPGDPGAWCSDCRSRRDEGPLPKAQRRPRIVNLPVSATEDRLVGTLDFEAALKRGERTFQPGLLAEANRGILYVDEVNLLDDHLVDTLLDAAAMGVNSVEREGVSHVHPARFILVGTMNPEEGDIRPQLLDRFGLCVEVQAVREPDARVEIVRRRHAFEEDPSRFARAWDDAEQELQARLRHARLRLPTVRTSDEVLYAIADLAIRAGVDGHRADSVMSRAAAAHAALDGRAQTELLDVEAVAPLVLIHRLRRTPFDKISTDTSALRESLTRALSGVGKPDPDAASEQPVGPGDGQVSIFETVGTAVEPYPGPTSSFASLETSVDRTRRSMAGRRQETISADGRGRYVRAEADTVTSVADVAIDATIRAASVRQGARSAGGDTSIDIRSDDLRRKIRKRRVGASIVFCVDASGSMGASKRIETAKAAALELLVDAYQRRDRVSVVSFRGDSAEVLLPPTSSVELANLTLRELPTGGSTPLAAGMLRGIEVLEAEKRREPDIVPWLVLLTDGRGNVGLEGGVGSQDARSAAVAVRSSGINAVLIDTTSSSANTTAQELARVAGAEYVRLRSGDGKALVSAVKARI